MTLTEDVCEHCNSVIFSPLDDELIRFVRPFLKRTMKVQRSFIRESLSLTYDEEKGVWTAVRIDSAWKPIVCPQVAFISPTTVKVSFDSHDGTHYRVTFSSMIEELRNPTTLTINEWISPLGVDSTPSHPILVRTAIKCYLIIAGSRDEVSALKPRIISGNIASGLAQLIDRQPPEYRKVEQPEVSGVIRRDFSEIDRAVIKTAINYVCKVFGPDVARCSELESLRTYARVGGVLSEAVDFAYDRIEFREIEDMFGSVCAADEHALILITSSNGKAAVLQFLEGRLFYVVTLGAIPNIPNGNIVVTTFNPQNRTYATSDFEPPELTVNVLRIGAAPSQF